MTVWRLLVGAGGFLAAVVGVRALLDEGIDGIVAAAWWLVAGVLVHDGVLAPLTILAGLLAGALVPPRLRAPVVAGGIVLGTVTVMAIPVLGRFGAREDNPTLLDRDYRAGWLVFAGLTLVVVVAWTVLRAGRERRRQS